LTPFGADPYRVPVVDDVRMRASFTRSGIAPDAVLADGVPADVQGTFAPFGPDPAAPATLHLASADAFAHPGAEASVHLTFLTAGRAGAATPVLTVEFHDGTAWQSLANQQPTDGPAGFTRDGDR